jgi:hypothetical protein
VRNGAGQYTIISIIKDNIQERYHVDDADQAGRRWKAPVIHAIYGSLEPGMKVDGVDRLLTPFGACRQGRTSGSGVAGPLPRERPGARVCNFGLTRMAQLTDLS